MIAWGGPQRSVEKVVGSPVWGVLPWLETQLRWAGLLLGPLAGLWLGLGFWDGCARGGVGAGWRAAGRSLVTAALGGLLARTVVVTVLGE